MKIKPRFIVIILTIGTLFGFGVAKLTLQPKVIVETEYRTITKKLEVIKFHSLDIEEIIVLSKIVEAEATGGTVNQKINVAHAVLNRVRSQRYPNTIKKVVFQDNQFSPIYDKRYYKVNITETTVEAVSKAIKGENYHQAKWFLVEKDSAESNVSWFKSNLEFVFNDGIHSYYTKR